MKTVSPISDTNRVTQDEFGDIKDKDARLQRKGFSLEGRILRPFTPVSIPISLLTEESEALSPDRPLSLSNAGQSGMVTVGEPFEWHRGDKSLPQAVLDRCDVVPPSEWKTTVTREDGPRREVFLSHISGAERNLRGNEATIKKIDEDITRLSIEREENVRLGERFAANLQMHRERLTAFYSQRGNPVEQGALYDAAANAPKTQPTKPTNAYPHGARSDGRGGVKPLELASRGTEDEVMRLRIAASDRS
jgi:hypothetical protein